MHINKLMITTKIKYTQQYITTVMTESKQHTSHDQFNSGLLFQCYVIIYHVTFEFFK